MATDFQIQQYRDDQLSDYQDSLEDNHKFSNYPKIKSKKMETPETIEAPGVIKFTVDYLCNKSANIAECKLLLDVIEDLQSVGETKLVDKYWTKYNSIKDLYE